MKYKSILGRLNLGVWRGQKGASTTEYAVLVGVIGVLIILTISSIGNNVSALFNRVAGLFDGEGAAETVAAVPDVPPVIASITVSPDATYGSGGFIDFTLIYDKPVTLAGGVPDFSIEVGVDGSGAVIPLTYLPLESDETELHFRYIVQVGDVDLDGVKFASTALNLNAATLVEAAVPSVNAGLDFPLPLPDLGAILIDDTIPTITEIILPEDLIYRNGENIDIVFRFSRAVTAPAPYGAIFANARFDLMHDFGLVNVATYVSGSGTSDILFRFTATHQNASAGLLLQNFLFSVPVAATDDMLKIADMTLPEVLPFQTNIIIDNVAPTATIQFSQGGFEAGEVITAVAFFDEPVTIVDNSVFLPVLVTATLNQAEQHLEFDYVASMSTDIVLAFQYTVQATDIVEGGMQALTAHASGFTWGALSATKITDIAGNPSDIVPIGAGDVTVFGPEVNFVLLRNGVDSIRVSADGAANNWYSMILANSGESHSFTALGWLGDAFGVAGVDFGGSPNRALLMRSEGGGIYEGFEDPAITHVLAVAGSSAGYGVIGTDGSSTQTALRFSPVTESWAASVPMPTTGITWDLLWLAFGSTISQDMTGGAANYGVSFINAMADGGGKMVAVGSNSTFLYSNDNGQNWNTGHLLGLIDDVNCVPKSGGGSTCTMTRNHRNYNDVAYGAGTFVAVASNGGNSHITVSFSGSVGPNGTSTDAENLPGVNYGGGNSGMLLGLTWVDIEPARIPANPNFYGVTSGGGSFYAAGGIGTTNPVIYSSSDGIDWVALDMTDIIAAGGVNQTMAHIAYSGVNGGSILATSLFREYLSTDGGANWVELGVSGLTSAHVAGRP